MTLPCILLKTPWGYIDLLNTWEGWTLIGAVVLALAVLAWMEWGKVKCKNCEGLGVISYSDEFEMMPECPVCHGSGRVRRGWLSKTFNRIAAWNRRPE